MTLAPTSDARLSGIAYARRRVKFVAAGLHRLRRPGPAVDEWLEELARADDILARLEELLEYPHGGAV